MLVVIMCYLCVNNFFVNIEIKLVLGVEWCMGVVVVFDVCMLWVGVDVLLLLLLFFEEVLVVVCEVVLELFCVLLFDKLFVDWFDCLCVLDCVVFDVNYCELMFEIIDEVYVVGFCVCCYMVNDLDCV